MKSEGIYNTWKERKSHVEVSNTFSDRVMSRIYEYEQVRARPFFDIQRLVERVSAHALAKAGLVAAGAAMGLVRLIFVILVILSRGDTNG
ncbi:MAG: hypothetical protein ACYSX1_01145 [Planctomycetota bacterium]|jgi:hypothetical protein